MDDRTVALTSLCNLWANDCANDTESGVNFVVPSFRKEQKQPNSHKIGTANEEKRVTKVSTDSVLLSYVQYIWHFIFFANQSLGNFV